MLHPDGTHLAEINIAKAMDDLDSERLTDFVANLDRINELAERSPDFFWRLKDKTGNATDIQVDSDPRLIPFLNHQFGVTLEGEPSLGEFRTPARPHKEFLTECVLENIKPCCHGGLGDVQLLGGFVQVAGLHDRQESFQTGNVHGGYVSFNLSNY